MALGATRWEMIKGVVFPHSFGGMVGAVMLGLGRAMGETIAVALVIGAAVQITPNLFAAVTRCRRSSCELGRVERHLPGRPGRLRRGAVRDHRHHQLLARIVVSRAETRLKGAAA